MWAHPSATTAGEVVEDITLIVKTYPMPFPCLSSHFNYFLSALENVACQKLPPRVPVLSN